METLKRRVRFLILFLAVAALALPILKSDAQMEQAVIDASAAAAVKEEIKQPLPKPGNVTVNFKDVDIRTVLHYLSEVSGVDIVPSPGVDAQVSMRLRDKPWEVALDIVTRNYGYAYSRDEERGIIRVIPREQMQLEEPITEVILLNYIVRGVQKSDEGQGTQSPATPTSEALGGMAQVVVQTEEEMDPNISRLLRAINSLLNTEMGESSTYLPNANAIVVTAIPARIARVKELVAKVDRKTPQITLEVKVIEITLDRNDQFGIDWNMVFSAAGARRPVTFPFTNSGALSFLRGEQRRWFPTGTAENQRADFPYIDLAGQLANPTAAATANSIFSFGTLDFSNFTATLRMIDEWDDTDIISSPRITTLNNQPATIKVVTNLFLQEQQTSTDTANVVTVSFEDEPREIGVILEVIPHVNEKEEITVDLRPRISRSITFTELAVSNSQNTVAMQYASREADTRVMVKDGETIFIGGLITEQTTTEDHRVPVLGDLLGGIPFIGRAFKYKQDNVDKTETVFFVTVHLVKDGMHSVEASETMPQYRKYYLKEEDDDSGERKKWKKPPLRTGHLKVKNEYVEVPTSQTGRSRQQEEYKPFLDFRKKASDSGE